MNAIETQIKGNLSESEIDVISKQEGQVAGRPKHGFLVTRLSF